MRIFLTLLFSILFPVSSWCAPTTVNAVASDYNSLYAGSTTYLTARNNTDGSTVANTVMRCGLVFADPNYTVNRTYLSFDLSGIPAGAII